jgi:hypothetical protein
MLKMRLDRWPMIILVPFVKAIAGTKRSKIEKEAQNHVYHIRTADRAATINRSI